jgi:hypothetical protein
MSLDSTNIQSDLQGALDNRLRNLKRPLSEQLFDVQDKLCRLYNEFLRCKKEVEKKTPHWATKQKRVQRLKETAHDVVVTEAALRRALYLTQNPAWMVCLAYGAYLGIKPVALNYPWDSNYYELEDDLRHPIKQMAEVRSWVDDPDRAEMIGIVGVNRPTVA